MGDDLGGGVGGTLAAIYQPLLIASPWFVFTQYPTVLLVTIAASSGGFLVTVLVELLEDVREPKTPHTGEAFPYGSATGADVKTSATYSFAVSAPGSTGVSLWIVSTFAGVLALIMMGLAIWLSRRPNAV